MTTDDKSVDRDEFQTQELIDEEHPRQKAVEMISEEKPESPGTVTMVPPVHRWQREWLDTGPGEQEADGYITRATDDAEARSAEIIAEARQKAKNIIRDAEKASVEVADSIKTEAHVKSREIINDGQKKADEILDEGRRTAAELINKSNLQAAEQSKDIITEAREQAEQIIKEARDVANEIVMLDKSKKANGKITGRDIIISSTLILVGIVIIVLAYLYVRYGI